MLSASLHILSNSQQTAKAGQKLHKRHLLCLITLSVPVRAVFLLMIATAEPSKLILVTVLIREYCGNSTTKLYPPTLLCSLAKTNIISAGRQCLYLLHTCEIVSPLNDFHLKKDSQHLYHTTKLEGCISDQFGWHWGPVVLISHNEGDLCAW